MKPEEALKKIEELGKDLMYDKNEFVQVLGAAIVSLPLAAENGETELMVLIEKIFSASRERMQRVEEADSVIKDLLDEN